MRAIWYYLISPIENRGLYLKRRRRLKRRLRTKREALNRRSLFFIKGIGTELGSQFIKRRLKARWEQRSFTMIVNFRKLRERVSPERNFLNFKMARRGYLENGEF